MNIRDLLKNKNIANVNEPNDEHLSSVRHCAICGATEDEVNLIIQSGTGEYICDKCADTIYRQMDEIYQYAEALIDLTNVEKKQEELNKLLANIPTPHEIKAFLDEYVIGQDEAKVKLAVAVYNHYKRICQSKDETEISKSCCALIGATGSGKCVSSDAMVTIRDKKTGEVKTISINDFKNSIA